MENLLETKEKCKQDIKDSELRKMFQELAIHNTEEEKVVNELFYNSVKMVLDTGFDLASELNEDLLADTIKKTFK